MAIIEIGPIFDSFTNRHTMPETRNAELSPSEVVHNFEILSPEVVEINVEAEDEEPIPDQEDWTGLYGRMDIDPEVIQELSERPKVRFLKPEEVEQALRQDKIKKMTELEKDVEGRFGML